MTYRAAAAAGLAVLLLACTSPVGPGKVYLPLTDVAGHPVLRELAPG
jgi:hypothetical protein